MNTSRLLTLALVLTAFLPLSAQTPPSQDVLIVYDGSTNYESKSYIHALFVQNLLGHFSLQGEIVPLGQYEPGQLARYRAGFFVGTDAKSKLPKAFLDDVHATAQPFCWLGMHIGDLTNSREGNKQYGFQFVEYVKFLGINRVFYKDTLLPKTEPDLNVIKVTDQKGVETVATAATRDKVWHPYVVRRNRFWYFADSPFAYPDEGGHYLAFCDLLHDVLEIQHKPEQRALVRVEDVSVDDDPVDLRRVSDLLAGYHIPFQIALIPIFRDPAQEIEIHLSDRKSFVDTVHYMISRGGTPLMHGITHQYRTASGDDYEFWDETGNKAVVGDSTEFVMRRMRLGLSECFAAGIFPVAFETPHYAASEIDYRAMMRVFDLFYDRTISTPSLNSQQYFPYPVTDHWGRRVVPEDLGYLPEEKPDPKVVIERARNLRVVRDGVASFYFHPFLNVDLLEETVRGIQGLGYHFVSVREFSSAVDFQGHFLIRTASGPVHLQPRNEFTRMRVYDRSGKLMDTEVSSQRRTGDVEVAVDVPQGGWAALDCLRERPPQQQNATSFTGRVQQWWSQVWAPERTSASHTFATGKKAWLLTVDKPAPSVDKNQSSYQSVLDTFGYQVKLVKASEFAKAPAELDTVLIVPEAAAARMNAKQQSEVLRYLDSGGDVVAEGKQEWLKKLGFAWEGRTITVAALADQLFPEMQMRWLPEEKVERFEPPEGVRELVSDNESDQALAISGDYGAGHYVHLAIPFDPYTPDGTSHYPYFAHYLTESFGASSSVRSPRLEVYFDPAYRPGVDLNRLAQQWRMSGVRTVYAAAWVFTPNWEFPYGDFVRACHRAGISVYAWFMPPMTSWRMWEQHPEWRERNALDKDARPSWRYLLNFQNPACFRASMDWMKGLLNKYDWDGVNIAELNYDPGDFKDYLALRIRPESFYPMNADVRADFRKKAGFDPIRLFQSSSDYYYKEDTASLQKFLRYRESLVVDLHRRVLAELEPMRREKGWEIIVTMMDSLHSKYVRQALGVDSKRIVGLMKDFNFTLQVEDPSEWWMKPGERYLKFAQTYKKLVKDPRRLMFDVNVLPGRDITGTNLPSKLATGTELARTIVAAMAPTGRAAIYSENSVPWQDWSFLRIALTRSTALSSSRQDWRIDTPHPILLAPAEDRDYYLDGKLWPAVSTDGVLVPSGHHWLSNDRPWHHFLDPGTMPARLLSISGDLEEARVIPTGLVFHYSSPGRAIAVFNQRPREVLVDGRRVPIPMELGGGNWSGSFPAGEHWVAVVTNTNAGVAVNLWGWASASAIQLFGGVATVLMALIYFEVRLRRLIRRRPSSGV